MPGMCEDFPMITPARTLASAFPSSLQSGSVSSAISNFLRKLIAEAIPLSRAVIGIYPPPSVLVPFWEYPSDDW